MLQSGRIVFGNMDAVVFGRATADALIEEAHRRESKLRFLDGQWHPQPN